MSSEEQDYEDLKFYEDKLQNAIRYALFENPDEPSPPEAKWYLVWSLVLSNLVFDDPHLYLAPQAPYRIQTDNFGNLNKSTKYTDLSVYELYIKIGVNIICLSRSLASAEIKPKKIATPAEINACKSQAMMQGVHYLLSNTEEISESNVLGTAIIAIYGDRWSWAKLKKNPGAPHPSTSERSAASYLMEVASTACKFVPHGPGTNRNWSPFVTLGTPESKKALEDLKDAMEGYRFPR